MQSASKGLGHFASGVRSLHVYAPRLAAPRPPPTTAGRLLQTTRTVFTRFFAHLTTPGLSHPVAGSTAGLSTRVNAAVRPQTIQQRLSLPARHALSQPKPPFFPRASQASRSTVHVGLGTARNFSTARPLFQHLAQNVPVAGRAVYEADWDVERRKMKDKARRDLKASKAEKENVRSVSRAKPIEKAKKVAELERYFPVSAPAAPGVTTFLLVPLAPTPTARLPLTETRFAEPSLLVVSDVQDILSSHHMHTLRVSSLFARLDACRVWENGAAFTAHGDASGLCTVLRMEFKGWTAAMVREVMGDAGKGWCRLVETSDGDDSPRSASPEVDPAASVVLPTLDFSASFHAACASAGSQPPSPPMSLPPSPLLSASELSDAPSDFDIDMDTIFESDSDSGSMLSFSSDFLARSE